MDAHGIDVERLRSLARRGMVVRGYWIVGERDEQHHPEARFDAVAAWFRNPLGNVLLLANLVLVGRSIVSAALLEASFRPCYAGSGRVWPGLALAEAFLGGLYVLVSAPSWMVVNTVCAFGQPVLEHVEFSTRADIGLALFVVASSFQWLAVGNVWPAFAKAINEAFCFGSQQTSDSIVPKAAPLRMLDAAFVTPMGSPLEDVLQDPNRVAVGFDRRVENATVPSAHR